MYIGMQINCCCCWMHSTRNCWLRAKGLSKTSLSGGGGGVLEASRVRGRVIEICMHSSLKLSNNRQKRALFFGLSLWKPKVGWAGDAKRDISELSWNKTLTASCERAVDRERYQGLIRFCKCVLKKHSYNALKEWKILLKFVTIFSHKN